MIKNMNEVNKSHRFKVGAFECLAINDGTFTYGPPTFPPPATFLFANAPKGDLDCTLHKHNLDQGKWTEWISPYICMVIKTGEHVVLVDTGADGLGPNTGKLLQNLGSERISPSDINKVILTHGHPDHIGGNTLMGGKPAFPDARFIMWKDEWNFWTSEEAELKIVHGKEVLLGFANNNLPPIKAQIDLVDHETEILPGIRAIGVPGHTPGHMALVISSEGEQLLCVSDSFLHPIHVEQPEWHSMVDYDPKQVTDTRRRLLNMAATKKALVSAFHFPFPGLGHITRNETGCQWQPINTGCA